jgi:hypothetical protein
MNRGSVWLLVAGVAVIAALLGVLQREPSQREAQTNLPVDPVRSASISPVPRESDSPPAVVVQTPPIIDPETDMPLIPPLPLQTGELAWEASIRSVLSRDKATDAEKAIGLFQLLPGMPAEGAETCAEEAVKRLPNAEYRHAQAAVSNPGTYGLALGVLFSDLMERPDNLRLPTLVTIARNSAHPYAAPAHDNLELLLGQDFGEDWSRWENAVREKIKGAK